MYVYGGYEERKCNGGCYCMIFNKVNLVRQK